MIVKTVVKLNCNHWTRMRDCRL